MATSLVWHRPNPISMCWRLIINSVSTSIAFLAGGRNRIGKLFKLKTFRTLGGNAMLTYFIGLVPIPSIGLPCNFMNHFPVLPMRQLWWPSEMGRIKYRPRWTQCGGELSPPLTVSTSNCLNMARSGSRCRHGSWYLASQTDGRMGSRSSRSKGEH